MSLFLETHITPSNSNVVEAVSLNEAMTILLDSINSLSELSTHIMMTGFQLHESTRGLSESEVLSAQIALFEADDAEKPASSMPIVNRLKVFLAKLRHDLAIFFKALVIKVRKLINNMKGRGKVTISPAVEKALDEMRKNCESYYRGIIARSPLELNFNYFTPGSTERYKAKVAGFSTEFDKANKDLDAAIAAGNSAGGTPIDANKFFDEIITDVMVAERAKLLDRELALGGDANKIMGSGDDEHFTPEMKAEKVKLIQAHASMCHRIAAMNATLVSATIKAINSGTKVAK